MGWCPHTLSTGFVGCTGKSTLLLLTINKLISEGVDKHKILYFNFDDERISFNKDNLGLILAAYRELYPDNKLDNCYLFFDEIQIADDWQAFIRRVYEEECRNIFITGSNSQMLSSEIASSMRGRSLQYEEYPLSFHEICRFRGVDTNIYSDIASARLFNLFDEYITWGGFPEIIMADTALKERILSDYFYVMLYRDLIERFKINPATTVKYFIRRIMENITKPTSINKIYKELKSLGISVGKDAVYSFAEQCEAVYMFLPLYRYTGSVQRSTTSETKYYCIDIGLRKLSLKPKSDDNGKALENAVFLHLRRSMREAQSLTYYKGTAECDFILASNGKVDSLIQVSWDISDNYTQKREIDGLVEAAKATGCDSLTIVTYAEESDIDTDAGTIHVLPAWKWMLTSFKKQ